MMANLLSACEEKMKLVAVENQYMKPRIITDLHSGFSVVKICR